MKVKELIQQLQKCDPESPVLIWNCELGLGTEASFDMVPAKWNKGQRCFEYDETGQEYPATYDK